jgi:hypothetical protein
MGWLKDKFRDWLEIKEAQPLSVFIQEPLSYDLNVFKNQLWYRGDPSELHQFYTSIDDSMNNTDFWAARSTTGINFRKIHSGLPSLIVDVLVDIVISDLIDIKVDNTEAQKRWDDIAEDNDFQNLLKSAVREVLVEGDGAFKISYDKEISDWPIIEFYSGRKVRYIYKRGRLEGVDFITKYNNEKRPQDFYVLEEEYRPTGVTYHLYKANGDEVALSTIPELSDLKPIANDNEFMLAEQMMLSESAKFEGRGKSLFDNKDGPFDAFDECISQWVEAMRDGRTTKYIPQTLIPQSPVTGAILKPNSFDNRYVQTGADLAEDGKNEIKVLAGEIPHDALLASYTTLLDLCLQGLVSPSTLGIDVKKLDNAEAQREKEKTTLYTRNRIVDKLEELLPELVGLVLKTDDMLNSRTPGDYSVSVSFGEYANPSFEAQVETVGKAKQYGIMSLERCVEELYGDSLTDEDKATEIERLRAEQGVVELPFPNMKQELETPVPQPQEGAQIEGQMAIQDGLTSNIENQGTKSGAQTPQNA